MSLCPASVLITGANRGIGLEFVRQFLGLPSPPKYVFAACRSPDSAKDLQEIAKKSDAVKIIRIVLQNAVLCGNGLKEGRKLPDVLDHSSIKESVEEVKQVLGDKGLSLVINNAGILKMDNLSSVTPETMTEHFNIHVTGPLVVVQSYLPLLKKAANKASGLSVNTSAVINISSGLGSIADNTSGRMYAYRAAKAAQNMITRSLAIDLKGDGIFVTTIHPGWVKTDMGSQRANLTTEDSVKSMFKVMATFQSENEAGKFHHYYGGEMPW